MKTLVLCILMLLNLAGFATITTSNQTGNWNTASTWDNGVPSCGDTIVISSGHTVTIATTVDLTSCTDSNWVRIYGELHFNTGKKLYLPAGSQVHVYSTGSITTGGGGGNSSVIEIGGTVEWKASDGDINPGNETLLPTPGPGDPVFPVDLLSFYAIAKPSYVSLYWQTASEINSEYFEVERSTDGSNWEVIGRVEAAGNSNLLIDYSFIDHNPIMGNNYYRLLQMDYDGKYEYFGPVNQRFDKNEIEAKLKVYPNPIESGNINISIGKQMLDGDMIAIYDYSGRLLKTITLNEKTSLKTINISQYAKGIYFIRYINSDSQLTEKLIIR